MLTAMARVCWALSVFWSMLAAISSMALLTSSVLEACELVPCERRWLTSLSCWLACATLAVPLRMVFTDSEIPLSMESTARARLANSSFCVRKLCGTLKLKSPLAKSPKSWTIALSRSRMKRASHCTIIRESNATIGRRRAAQMLMAWSRLADQLSSTVVSECRSVSSPVAIAVSSASRLFVRSMEATSEVPCALSSFSWVRSWAGMPSRFLSADIVSPALRRFCRSSLRK